MAKSGRLSWRFMEANSLQFTLVQSTFGLIMQKASSALRVLLCSSGCLVWAVWIWTLTSNICCGTRYQLLWQELVHTRHAVMCWYQNHGLIQVYNHTLCNYDMLLFPLSVQVFPPFYPKGCVSVRTCMPSSSIPIIGFSEKNKTGSGRWRIQKRLLTEHEFIF